MRLYVGNLPYRFNDENVKELFSPYGDVSEVKVICDYNTGRSKGFAFVTFSNAEDAQKAATELHESEVDGRNLKVSLAHEREPRKSSGGGGHNHFGGGGGQGRRGGGHRSGGQGRH